MKKYLYVISGIILSTLIVLILIVEHKGNYYRVSPEEVHEIVLDTEVIITSKSLSKQKEPIIIICLSQNVEDSTIRAVGIKTLFIKPADLLKSENRRFFKDNSGTIILQSNDFALEANSWVLLTRMGYANIKIWNNKFSDKLNFTTQNDTLTTLK